MVALRSDRRDRTLVVVLWVLTLAVLGTGIASVNPVLIFWGALGVAGSVFLTRIHVRDTGAGAVAGAGAVGGAAVAGAGAPGAGEAEVGEETSR